MTISTNLLLALSTFDSLMIFLLAALLIALVAIRLRRNKQSLPSTVAPLVAQQPAVSKPEPISSRKALPLVVEKVDAIRATGAQLEICNQGERSITLQIRHSSKEVIGKSGFETLLRSISGVESVRLSGGDSKGKGRPRTPITLSIYFTDDADGHHASLNVREASE